MKKHDYIYVSNLFKEKGFYLISDRYMNTHSKLEFADTDGYKYYMSFHDFLNESIPQKFSRWNPFTVSNIKLWCLLNVKPFILLSEKYINNRAKLKWKCLRESCQQIFFADWSSIYSANTGCRICSSHQISDSNCLATVNSKLAQEWHTTKNGNLTPYNIMSQSSKKVWWQCSKNSKHIWLASPNQRTKSGCPYCSGRFASEDYNLLLYYPYICNEWNYSKNDKLPIEYTPVSGKKVWWICRECGYEWVSSISNRVKGRCCPKCAESKGEKRIRKLLEENHVIFESQYDKFSDLLSNKGNPLRFDFMLFKDKNKSQIWMAIEYDGVFHFEKQYENDGSEIVQCHDKLKNQYCKNNKIKLKRIHYKNFDNIEKILMKELNLKAGDKI